MATSGSFEGFAISDYKGSTSANYRYGLRGDVEVLSSENGKSKVKLVAYFITYNTVKQSSQSYNLTLGGDTSVESAPAVDLSGGGSLAKEEIGSKTVEIAHNSSGKVSFSATIGYNVSVGIIWTDNEYGSTYTLNGLTGSFILDPLTTAPTIASDSTSSTDTTITSKIKISDNGGENPTKVVYKITSPITSTKTYDSNTLTHTFSSLTPAREYTVTIVATNSAGDSNTVTQKITTTCSAPGKVTSVTLTGTPESLNKSVSPNRTDLNTTSTAKVSWVHSDWGSLDNTSAIGYYLVKLYTSNKDYIDGSIVKSSSSTEYKFNQDINVFDELYASVEPYFWHTGDSSVKYTPGATSASSRYIYYDKFLYTKPAGNTSFEKTVAWIKPAGTTTFRPLIKDALKKL